MLMKVSVETEIEGNELGNITGNFAQKCPRASSACHATAERGFKSPIKLTRIVLATSSIFMGYGG